MYDLIVIGGGPGGYTGAIRAAKKGLKTALIEEKQLGGTCLNRGCIPTKALLHSAEIYAERDEWRALGIDAGQVTYNEDAVYARKEQIVSTLRGGVEKLLKANGVEIFNGHGYLVDAHTVKVNENQLQTKYILLATGTKPSGFDPARPIEGVDQTLNSDDVLSSPVAGNSVIIMGAGVIAIEFASYFASIGKAVTVLAPSDRIIRMMSKDVSAQLAMQLKKRGVKILTSVKIKKLSRTSALIETEAGGEQTLTADAVISAVGRSAVLDGLGLENVGLKAGKAVTVDDNMYTGVEDIYACGDIIGKIQLAHYAAASAIRAVESMVNAHPSMDLSVCPSCIYTKPEIASVGLKEPDLEGAKVGKFMMGGNGKAMIEGLGRGFVKVVADSTDTIVGAELFCSRATDIIGELALAVKTKMKVHEAASVIHPHPTVMEAVGEAYEDIFGMATHILPR